MKKRLSALMLSGILLTLPACSSEPIPEPPVSPTTSSQGASASAYVYLGISPFWGFSHVHDTTSSIWVERFENKTAGTEILIAPDYGNTFDIHAIEKDFIASDDIRQNITLGEGRWVKTEYAEYASILPYVDNERYGAYFIVPHEINTEESTTDTYVGSSLIVDVRGFSEPSELDKLLEEITQNAEVYQETDQD